MAQVITLFDLPSRNGNHCWSPNTWKARMYLNYKGLPYKTVWIEYPDIKPRLEGHVAADATGLYTLPAILLPDGTYIMDSKNIAEELDKRQPENSVQVQSSVVSQAEATMVNIKKFMSPETIPNVPKLFLNEASQPYFYETRAKKFGMSLDQVTKEKAGVQCFANARPHVKELTSLLKQNSDGPFFGGQQITFADIEWASLLRFFQKVDGALPDKLLSEDKEVHLALFEACKPWLERDNY